MKKGSYAPAVTKKHGEGEAGQIVMRRMVEFRQLNETEQPTLTRKGDPREVTLVYPRVCFESENAWIPLRNWSDPDGMKSSTRTRS